MVRNNPDCINATSEPVADELGIWHIEVRHHECCSSYRKLRAAGFGGVTLPVDALRAAHHCARISDSVLKPDDPRRRWLPALMNLLDTEISTSRSRSENHSARRELDMTDLIGTAAAAQIIERTQRYVQQIATSLGGVKIEGRYVFHRDTLIAYHRDRIQGGDE